PLRSDPHVVQVALERGAAGEDEEEEGKEAVHGAVGSRDATTRGGRPGSRRPQGTSFTSARAARRLVVRLNFSAIPRSSAPCCGEAVNHCPGGSSAVK